MTTTLQCTETVGRAGIAPEWQISNAHLRVRARLGLQIVNHIVDDGMVATHISIECTETKRDDGVDITYVAELDELEGWYSLKGEDADASKD